jgi:hypothetical protein
MDEEKLIGFVLLWIVIEHLDMGKYALNLSVVEIIVRIR